MKKLGLFLMCGIAMLFMSSCHTYTHSMKTPNSYVEYHAEDFNLSDQVTGEATVVRVIGIDWQHLFGTKEIGETTSVGTTIPFVGMAIPTGANYALYNMMQKNPGYDVVIYPQVETYRHAPVLGTDIYSKTTYKVTARLGKLKK
ncbi:MAG: hypothetical protein IJP44_08980 [Bacteroidales bacterium]|nr:hypothetical protein [Bacteroidales bacterium]